MPRSRDLGGQFDGLEGVARGDRPALAAERVVGLLTERRPGRDGRRRGGERCEVDGALSGPPGAVPRNGCGVVGEFVGAVGDDEQHRQFFGARRERGEPAQRLGVGPVGVVEDQDDGARCTARWVSTQSRPSRTPCGSGGAPSSAAHRPSAGATMSYQLPSWQRSIGLAGAGELRLDQLADDMEGDPLLLLAAAGGSTVQPRAAARRRTSVSSVVLPMPARPAKASSAPRGARAVRGRPYGGR